MAKARFELATHGFSVRCYYQLSYLAEENVSSEDRTRNRQRGKLELYQLSYTHINGRTGGTRTHTMMILSHLPLPIGLQSHG
jgi:hypothetical protein